MPLPRLRLARETRLLLVTVVLSAATLLVLARFRYPDAPAPALPREQPLQRLAAEALFDELAATVSRARSRLSPFVPVLQYDAAPAPGATGPGPRRAWVPVLRFRETLAVAAAAAAPGPLRVLTDQGAVDATLVAEDRARGFAVIRLHDVEPLAAPPPIESPSPRAAPPGYAVAVDGAPGGAAARPVYVDRLDPLARTLWPAARALPASLRPGQAGTVVANLEGRVVGIVLGVRELALVPAAAVVEAAERLLSAPSLPPATLGADLQDLNAALAAAVGATRGAIVAFVDPSGPAAGVLHPGDVIEDVQGEAVGSAAEVIDRVRAVQPGKTLLLGVRRAGEAVALQVTLAAAAPPAAEAGNERRLLPLGLTLVAERGGGLRVRAVAAASASARAGLAAGDVITWMTRVERLTASAARRAFEETPRGAALLVGVTRDGSHRVLVLERR